MFSSYRSEDVEILLKDISGEVKALSTEEREKKIQSGTHYSEMLPIEYEPSQQYMEIFDMALDRFADRTADAVAVVSKKIMQDKGKDVVLVSLARAGTSIGVLIKRYMEKYLDCTVKHYTISIIRDRGIDKNALNYILKKHAPEKIQFVDGWIGKGVIQRELKRALVEHKNIDPKLAVLADPAHISGKCGTYDDLLIASSCLNATVSGLISRTFLRDDIIGPDDFHGAVFYKELADRDLTYKFIDTIESHFKKCVDNAEQTIIKKETGFDEIEKISTEFGITNINYIKPGVGETTRVLLRRVPYIILVHSLDDFENLGHIYQLAKEKNVKVVQYPLSNYIACGIIKNIADA